jgi:hypothetical protein
MKMNWGTGVVIAMVSFIVFILTFVYRSVVVDKYQHELVSEDYYKDELLYQQEIDKMTKASELEVDLKLNRTSEGLVIEFPSDLDPEAISGTIRLQRPSNKKLDLELPIDLSKSEFLIPGNLVVSGKYQVVIDWKHDAAEYLFKDEIFY